MLSSVLDKTCLTVSHDEIVPPLKYIYTINDPLGVLAGVKIQLYIEVVIYTTLRNPSSFGIRSV